MKVEKYIEKIRPHVFELFKDDYSGHDISHLERTMKNAIYICKKEGGDELIVGISAFLHDIHRIMQNESGKFVSPEESLPKVREILSYTDLSKKNIEKICYCVEHHEKYNWNNNNVDDINALILQDADNLDAIGAIGIGRAFVYCGAHKSLMYDDSIPLNSSSDYTGLDGKTETTIHYLYHKLFKLGDNMNTETARNIALSRISFMKDFSNEFLDEWYANYKD